MKAKIAEKLHMKDQGKNLIVFTTFMIFLIVFASIGRGATYRTDKLSAAVPHADMVLLDEHNREFIETYMPYFEEFALRYDHQYSYYQDY